MDFAALHELSERVRSGRVALYHGGVSGLKVGDQILPPEETGVRSMKSDIERASFDRITVSTALVYVTSERSLAAAFAAYWARRASDRGWLYRIELDDVDLVADEDLPRGPFVSFQLPRARVAAILDRGVNPDESRHVRHLQRFVDLIA